MDELFKKYKERITALGIAEQDKEKIYNNFFTEIQFKLVNSFFDTLTDEQKELIAKAETDEEIVKTYFSLLSESIEIPEYLQFIEQVYTEAMMKAIAQLPAFNTSVAPQQ